MRFLYNLLFPIVFLLLLPGYLRRMYRRGSYRQDFWQRLGYYSPEVQKKLAAARHPILLQAVSVGEMLVALKLVPALRERSPGIPLVLCTTTTTGYAVARDQAPVGVEVIYTPIDLAGAVRRMFAVIRPAQLVVVDGGLWPNQLWQARERGIKTALVNARLSPRSERRFRRFPFFAKTLYGLLDLVCVADAADLPRWQSLGVAADRLKVTGSVKFDDFNPLVFGGSSASGQSMAQKTLAKREMVRSLGISQEAPILLGGSTHPGEEEALARVLLKLRERFPSLFLILAPRHVERASEIQGALERLGLSVVRRTQPSPPTTKPDVLLLDTTGELREWYPVGTVVFIGKSLCATGGQNPFEAISAGVPVIFGPRMENFGELAARLLNARAAVQVQDEAALLESCATLLNSPAERSRLVEAGQQQTATHRGAAGRTAEAILKQNGFLTCQNEEVS